MDDTRRMLAVVDLDGVLADVRHRLHHLERTPKDWPAFFADAVDDPVLEVGRDAVLRLATVHEVVYLSGRPERCRADTQRWLAAQHLPPGDLHLRPTGDFRPARDFKVEVLRRLAHRARVAVLVDDDPAVCEAARLAGFDVLPATWMGEEQQLWRAQEEDGAS
jgi:hypothetical protein